MNRYFVVIGMFPPHSSSCAGNPPSRSSPTKWSSRGHAGSSFVTPVSDAFVDDHHTARAAGVIERDEFEPRIGGLKARVAGLHLLARGS
jgi:hypothetical protein